MRPVWGSDTALRPNTSVPCIACREPSMAPPRETRPRAFQEERDEGPLKRQSEEAHLPPPHSAIDTDPTAADS
ncbi:unnamed protein product [Pleuronectes platessa]|uniref:Uncharacterized protein n=1 Tax=Pleuronectes platessa TaxID=8262 RepID=A0A9N7Z7J9_PLEPL|nr:unnamed protein product [Pleuronectes platessa]